MARLTEEMVIARAKQSDMSAVKKLNCWRSELVDVSLLRRMPNVEVLSLSVNKISTLVDFAYCSNLRELYVRKNRIADLTELRHLQALRRLQSLWLGENPCATNDNYRMTVLRALPCLEKLDNVTVTPEEVHEAMKKGTPIDDPENYDIYYPQDTYHQYRDRDARSMESSPDRLPEVDPDFRRCEQASDCSDQDASAYLQLQQDAQPPRLGTQQQVVAGEVRRRSYPHEQDDQLQQRFEQQARPQSHYYESSPVMDKLTSCVTAVSPSQPISPNAPTIRHSVSTHSIKEYSPPTARSTGAASSTPPPHYSTTTKQVFQQNNNRAANDTVSPTYQTDYYESVRFQPDTMRCPTDAWEQDRDKREIHRDNGGMESSAGPPIASALLSDYRGFVRRPVTRNSNLLSAVLCLVKELDYPSLEVTEMAVRCRMDELANGQ